MQLQHRPRGDVERGRAVAAFAQQQGARVDAGGPGVGVQAAQGQGARTDLGERQLAPGTAVTDHAAERRGVAAHGEGGDRASDGAAGDAARAFDARDRVAGVELVGGPLGHFDGGGVGQAAVDGQHTGLDVGGAGVAVRAAQHQGAQARLDQAAARVGAGDGAVVGGGETAGHFDRALTIHADAALGVEGQGGVDFEFGTVFDHQASCSGGAHVRTELQVAGDRERTASHDGVAAVGAVAREDQFTQAGLDEVARTGVAAVEVDALPIGHIDLRKQRVQTRRAEHVAGSIADDGAVQTDLAQLHALREIVAAVAVDQFASGQIRFGRDKAGAACSATGGQRQGGVGQVGAGGDAFGQVDRDRDRCA